MTTSVAAAESAAAKVRRVLPEALGRRLDALLETAEFTTPSRPVVEPEAAVLLLLAEAARDRRPVVLTYTASGGRRSERTVYPYGVVAHAGRWYVTGADSASGEVRTFRLDRIAAPEFQAGTFDVPAGFDPAAGAVRARRGAAPACGVVTGPGHRRRRPVPLPGRDRRRDRRADDDGWVQVRLQVERLDWVPAVLAGLGVPFTVEQPVELQELVRSLAARLTAAADGSPSVPA
ncbi:MAG: transcriptional regulator [Modestobacter sp.]|nr:transcriptional regulator [Modestobacter sp.]